MGYHWDNFVSKDRVLLETGMSQVICMIGQRQLRLLGLMGGSRGSDLVSRVVSEEISWSRMRPRGRPHVTWLLRIDGHWRDLELARRAPVWHSSHIIRGCSDAPPQRVLPLILVVISFIKYMFFSRKKTFGWKTWIHIGFNVVDTDTQVWENQSHFKFSLAGKYLQSENHQEKNSCCAWRILKALKSK